MADIDLKKLPHKTSETWDGYDLDELKYRRAYIAARRELNRERLLHSAGVLRGQAGSAASSVANRVARAVPLVNYGLIAFNLGSKVWQLVKSIRRK